MGTTTAACLKTLDFMAMGPHSFRSSNVHNKINWKNKKKPFSLSFSTRLFPLSALSERLNDGEAVKEVSSTKLLHVVLFSPQIPGNTGSIARSCAASGVGLHLIEPLGFQVDDTKLKRAGLDYWPPLLSKLDWRREYIIYTSSEKRIYQRIEISSRYVVVKQHSSWAEFRNYFSQQDGEKRLLAFTKRGTNIHSEFSYRKGDWLVFGSETSGLTPDALLDCSSEPFGGGTIRIPMIETYVRCLNLSVSVGIALYEASRQLNYEQFQCPSEPYTNDDNTQQPFITEDMFA